MYKRQPEEITLDDDDEEEDATWAETRLLSLKMPPLSRRVPDEDREARTQECRRLAFSGAYYQLASWVLLRSFLPYAASLTAPEASKDGAAYLAVLPVHKSFFSRRVYGLDAVDATPARWRGGAVLLRSIQPARPRHRRERT